MFFSDEGIPLQVKPRLSTFIYHNWFCKEIIVLLYDADTVDVDYNKQVVGVDNMMYHVVHDNNVLNLSLNEISNYVLFTYHLSPVFVQILCFCQLVNNFYWMNSLYQQFKYLHLQQASFCDIKKYSRKMKMHLKTHIFLLL